MPRSPTPTGSRWARVEPDVSTGLPPQSRACSAWLPAEAGSHTRRPSALCSKLWRMKTILRALVLLFVATPCFAQDAARMEEVVQSYVRDKTFMGAVLVARGSDVILSKGYGSANLEWDIPNTPATKFRLGSITKQFTAASILLLEERGKLKLDDPIKKHLPDAPAAWDAITIFNLLTHTSGIPNFTSLPDYNIAEAAGHARREDGRDRARQAARFRPGRENELQQLRLPRARRRDRAGHRRQLREVRDRQHLHAARHEGLRLRLEHRHHPAPRRRIHAVADRSGQRRLRPHEHPARAPARCTPRPRICCAGSRACSAAN